MCGIAGYFVTKPERVRPQAIQALAGNLLLRIESRGRDATGYAFVSRMGTKQTVLCKAPVAASDFLKIEGHLLTKQSVSSMPRSMLLHTRYATQGSPTDNRNNHPIYSKESGLCLVHNGWFIDDQYTVNEFELKKDAEVDTETYLRLIEKFYLQGETKTVESGIQAATSNIYGSLACAMIQGGKPGVMWVWRDQGQLVMALTDWGYVFASTKEAVLESLYLSCRSVDLSWYEIIPTPRETLFVIQESNPEPKLVRLESAPWEKAPSNINSKVVRYEVNGEKVIRRSRGPSVTTYGDYIDAEYSEWEGIYGHVDNRSRTAKSTGPEQPGLHSVPSGGTRTSDDDKKTSPDSSGKEENSQHEASCFCDKCILRRLKAHENNEYCGWNFCRICNTGKETTH